MPTVPSNFVPQADMQDRGEVPLQAPGVEPVRNLAADQQVQLGEAMTRAGNVAWNVGSNIQDHIDESGAKAADVQFLQSTQQLLNGKNGYFNQEGKNAEINFQATNEAMLQTANSISDSLPNETQRQMFKQAAARNLVSFQGQVLDHRNKQARVYALNESEARATEYAGQAAQNWDSIGKKDEAGNPIGKYSVALGVVDVETSHIGQLLGYAQDSEQMKALKQKFNGITATGVVDKYAKDGDYVSASNFLKDQDEKGMLDVKTRQSLMDFVDKNQKIQSTIEAAESIVYEGHAKSFSRFGYKPVIDPMTSKIVDPIHGTKYADEGVDYSAASGTAIKSPQDSVVESIKTEGKYDTITLRMRDGTKATITNLDNKLVYEGESIQSGTQIASAGTDLMHYTMERNGEFMNPQQANAFNAKEDMKNIKPPTSLRDALYIANQIDNKDLKEAVKNQVHRLWSENEGLKQQESQTLHLDALRFMADPKHPRVSDIPIAMRMKMEQTSPGTLAELVASENTKDDAEALWDAAQNPAKYTPEYLTTPGTKDKPSMADRISIKTKVGLLNTYQNFDARNERGLNAEQFKQVLLENGLENIVFPSGTDEQKHALAMQGLAIKEQAELRIANQEKATRKKLTMPEIQDVYEKVLMDRAATTSRSFVPTWLGGGGFFDPSGSRGSQYPIVAMTKDERESAVVTVGNQEVFLRDIPPKFIIQSTKELQDRKEDPIRNPSNNQIAQMWLSAKDVWEKNNKK